MTYTVKEVANLVGISVRTLHHYDAIGILPPDDTTESGYRLYSQQNLETLQQILFFKELGFSLKEIHQIIQSPSFDRREALILQEKMLQEKRKSIDEMIQTVQKTIQHIEGEISMTKEEQFKGFQFNNTQYEAEARRKWGNKTIDEANAKLQNLTTKDQQTISKQWEMIFTKLSQHRFEAPDSPTAQQVIGEWYNYLNTHIHTYSLDAFAGLGQLYIQDERFTENIDQYGEGLARFMCEAMAIYAKKQN